MKTISLFSGAGGMDFGATKVGAEIICAVEIDNDSANTHKKYFPNCELFHGDIINFNEFPEAELVIGGYPCQSFSRGGNRDPEKDERTYLYAEFARVLNLVNPKFFVAENVEGLRALQNGNFLKKQLDLFGYSGQNGYELTCEMLDAKNFGIPQTRKRVFIVGVRKDLELKYKFPDQTHGKPNKNRSDLKPYTSHGDCIADLPLWPAGEFYERPNDPDQGFSWYYMSRNRKAKWDSFSYTIVANWRHIPLHPASPKMELVWSNLKDGWKQRWKFSNEYEHIEANPERPMLEKARRLSWRECARIMGFDKGFEPSGNVESKFRQIGNAVPPELAALIIKEIITGKGLIKAGDNEKVEQHKLPSN